MKSYLQVAKAVHAGAVAFLGSLTACSVSGHITGYQWVVSAGAGVVGFTAVYATPPAPPGAV